MSWKLNRLLMPHAWRNIGFTPLFLLALYILGEYVISIIPPQDAGLEAIIWVFRILSWVGILFSSVDCICQPIEIFFLEGGNVYVKVYKEKQLGKIVYRLEIEKTVGKKTSKEIMYADEYCRPYNSDDALFFIYRPIGGNPEWYYRQAGKIVQRLGFRLNKILFRLHEGNKVTLSFLDWNGLRCEKVESYVLYKDIEIPPKTKVWAPNFPDELICVKKNGVYESFGFFFPGNLPRYQKIFASSLILKLGNKRLVLEADKNSEHYRELCCKTTLTNQLNSFIVEPISEESDRFLVNVARYDAQTERYVSQYTGVACFINFDTGEVLGIDGKTYGLED